VMWKLVKKNWLWAILILVLSTLNCEPAMAKIVKSTDAELDWLATNPGYIQGTMATATGPLILDDWQEEVCGYEGKFLLGHKTRQGGWSYGTIAARALAKSQLIKNNLSVIVSINLDDAKEKIRYARDLYDTIPRSHRSRLIIDNKMQLEFANGSRIVSMFMPRGKGPADVYLDEFAFNKRAREIYKAAIFMTLRGGQLFVGSTPLASAGMFWEIVTNAANKFARFHRIEIPWWHCTALCKDVTRAKLEAPLMTTHERVYAFGTDELISIYESTYIDDFCQECELKPQDDQESFFPIELIFSCVDSELALYDSFEALRENLRGDLFAGFDVGRRKNPSQLVITELLGDKFYVRMIVPFKNKSFDEQEFTLVHALQTLPISRMGIDETGIGMNIAENLSNMYPHIVEPINFAGRVEADIRSRTDRDKTHSVAIKERMATEVRIAFERHRISIPQDRELIQEIHSVKRETSPSGTVRFSVEKNDQHHADRFWALALAIIQAQAKHSAPGIAVMGSSEDDDEY
jgi:phage FluMu gp28-like protein